MNKPRTFASFLYITFKQDDINRIQTIAEPAPSGILLSFLQAIVHLFPGIDCN